jgi:threonyl-tRNA synthetase
MSYDVDEGGGAFYAPKIDVKLYDAIGREWQGPTVQVDLNLPNRFDVNFIGQDGHRQRVIMVHRAVLGSMERFCGGLIEHYAGVFPVWLAPVQVIVLPISDKHGDAAQKVLQKLRAADIRADIDDRSEKIGYRIRESQLEQIPYMLVIGDKEADAGLVNVRQRRNSENQETMSSDDFIGRVKKEIASRE